MRKDTHSLFPIGFMHPGVEGASGGTALGTPDIIVHYE